MSYNIRYASGGYRKSRHWQTRLPIMAEVISEPSIIGFQEVLSEQLADLKELMKDYSYVGVGRDDGKAMGEHVPIFYRNDQWRKAEYGHFWLSDTPEQPGSKSWGNGIPRMCTWVRLLDGNGKGIYVFNAHLDHMSWKSRRMSAAFIYEKIKLRKHKNDAVVLMGDLNCKPDSTPLKILLEDDKMLVDSFTVNPYDVKNSSTFNSWKASIKGNRRIDYVLTSPELKVLSAEILNIHKEGVVASDHNALRVTLDW